MNQDIEYLIKKGWFIFPCGEKSKKPITKHGFKDASKTMSQIEKWFVGTSYNVGIPTGQINNITVLDVDPRNGGHFTLEQFEVPETPYVETGGGGKQYYFQYSTKARNGNNIIGPGLDVKNDGGYVIAPPSIHPSGKPYIWCDEDIPLAPAPDWLCSDKFEKEIKSFTLTENPIPQGEQNDTLFRYACKLRHYKIPPGIIKDTLWGIINNKTRCPQDPKNPFTMKNVETWINQAYKYGNEEEENIIDPFLYIAPISLREFKKKEVPPVEYYVDGILQKHGRTMISAKSNMGKSFFLINMLSAICKQQEKFMDHFDICQEKINVLYFDFEMGESAMQERIFAMGDLTDLDNFFTQTIFGWDMLDKKYQEVLENFIEMNQINIVAFDPLGSLWSGDENKRENVKKVTDYFDYLISKYGVSICVTHHWRKSGKDMKEGGEMAAGSYGWTKNLDNHITLNGEPHSLVISCEKSRNQEKWGQIRASLNKETLIFDCLGEFKNAKKFTDEDLLGLFRSFGKQFITRPELMRKGKSMCSKSTLDRLLDETKFLKINKVNKPHIISLAEVQEQWDE